MNKSLSVIVGVVAVVSLILGGVAYSRSNDRPQVVVGSQGAVGPQGAKGEPGRDGKDGRDGITTIRTVTVPAPAPSVVLGAATGPDISSPYFSFGDLRKWAKRIDLQTATTTICAIQAPNATSSLVEGGLRMTTSSTTATIIHLAKATTAFATTTNLATYALAANAQLTLVSSSTLASEAGQSGIFAPNTWFNIGMQGGTGTHSPVGTCFAEFREI